MKTLLIDLETTPIRAYTWGPKWETNLIEVIDQSRILSFSAKWLEGKQVTKGWPDYKGYRAGRLDDLEIVKDIWNLIDEAELVVAQNGRDFDCRVMNARFLFHNLPPPSTYRLIDPKTEAKKIMRVPSNSLDDLCDYFGIGRKMEHEGFPLWTRCMAGDPNAWAKMKRYNAKDVVLMEKLYLKLRPYMKTHPNLSMYCDGQTCPKCGSHKLQKRGFQMTNSSKYIRYQCQENGCWSRGRVNVSDFRPLAT